MLAERSLNAQHDIVENARQGAATRRGSIEQKVGDFYALGHGRSRDRESRLRRRSRTISKRIDALKTPDDIVAFIRDYAAQGTPFVFGFSAQPDFHELARRMIAYARQGGLGLPERDYYLKTDDDVEEDSRRVRGARRQGRSSWSA